jgi:hypothetical protein
MRVHADSSTASRSQASALACGGPHRQHGGGLRHGSSRRVAQPGASLQKASQRQGAEPLTQSVRGANDLRCRAEMARVRSSTVCPRVVSSTRMASRSSRRHGSLRPTLAMAYRLLAQRRYRRSSPATPCRTLRAVDLNDPLAADRAAQWSVRTEAAVAFDGPQRRVVAPPEPDQPKVASRIGGNRQVLQDTDRRRGVGVLVGRRR